ncbi:MAG: DNA-binding protein, partial [Prevotella sp.]|nr:DNA-binding protein [Prevotella sp.]
MIKLNLYKNKIQGHKNFGKIYARAKNNDPIDIAGLSKHIHQHGSPYTRDVILGVLTKAASCIRELVLD